MISSEYFERLVTSVERIARHAYYPGIDEAIEQCLEDLDELMHAGRITADEREALRIVLLGMTLTSSTSTSNAA
jgi:predicted DNA-binding protein